MIRRLRSFLQIQFGFTAISTRFRFDVTWVVRESLSIFRSCRFDVTSTTLRFCVISRWFYCESIPTPTRCHIEFISNVRRFLFGVCANFNSTSQWRHLEDPKSNTLKEQSTDTKPASRRHTLNFAQAFNGPFAWKTPLDSSLGTESWGTYRTTFLGNYLGELSWGNLSTSCLGKFDWEHLVRNSIRKRCWRIAWENSPGNLWVSSIGKLFGANILEISLGNLSWAIDWKLCQDTIVPKNTIN